MTNSLRVLIITKSAQKLLAWTFLHGTFQIDLAIVFNHILQYFRNSSKNHETYFKLKSVGSFISIFTAYDIFYTSLQVIA